MLLCYLYKMFRYFIDDSDELENREKGTSYVYLENTFP